MPPGHSSRAELTHPNKPMPDSPRRVGTRTADPMEVLLCAALLGAAAAGLVWLAYAALDFALP